MEGQREPAPSLAESDVVQAHRATQSFQLRLVVAATAAAATGVACGISLGRGIDVATTTTSAATTTTGANGIPRDDAKVDVAKVVGGIDDRNIQRLGFTVVG